MHHQRVSRLSRDAYQFKSQPLGLEPRLLGSWKLRLGSKFPDVLNFKGERAGTEAFQILEHKGPLQQCCQKHGEGIYCQRKLSNDFLGT